MGLWIARGLLAAEHGDVWADNHPNGGADFTIVVPVTAKGPEPAGSPVL
jgi:signal transduction histidine kinase